MPVALAYLAVIMIWSTTPLAIQWSGQEVGPYFGLALRMLIGLGLLLVVVRVLRLSLPMQRPALRVYLTGGLPLFIAMTSVYWSAQFIPSGWIAVIFALTPFLTGLFSRVLLHQRSFTASKSLGLLLALGGLVTVFYESLSLASLAWAGLLGVCMAATVHSLGAVLLKQLRSSIHPISITAGSLLVATPLFVLHSLCYGLPDTMPTQALGAIVYLAVMGSAIGFPLYYFCLDRLSPEQVALITLVTPVLALILGATLNGEWISARVWTGSVLILLGLAVFEYGRRWPALWRRITTRHAAADVGAD